MPEPNPTPMAVQFGAGNIGRGFMGELFCRSGYHTRFVEIDRAVVDAIESRRAYEIHHITNEGDEAVTVDDVSAVDARNSARVAEAVADADLVCTAVGVRVLDAIAPSIAGGILRRIEAGVDAPLNVITCENLVGAGRHLRQLVWQHLATAADASAEAAVDEDAFDARFGFVEAVVSRMVPIVPDEVRRRDPLWIACEPYARLPVDGRAFRGPVPEIVGLEPVENILAYQRRKLACHNMSHALCAYLGYERGHEYIWQAMDDEAVVSVVRGAVAETGEALIRRFGFKKAAQRSYEEDLLSRYRNRALGDQVRRVAADPLRKLGPEDRLVGSARLCLDEGVDPVNVLEGIRAALAYDHPGDPSARRLQEMIRTDGLEAVLRHVAGLEPGETLFRRVVQQVRGAGTD